MTQQNRHGLSRTVPAAVKREIRQRCGFGCVVCGAAYIEYEHFDPDFADATEHNPAGMTLLCSQCNQKRARGRLSAETVAAANANPYCLRQGFSSEMFDFSAEPIEIAFSGVTFYDCRHVIVVNGFPLLSLAPPLEAGQPVRLSGCFSDAEGQETLTIKDNEWFVGAGNWDVECVGPRITIRNAPGEISLVLRMEPPTRLVVERIDMQFKGVRFRGDETTLEFSSNGTDWNQLTRCNASHSFTGINITHGFGSDPANDAVFDVD
ncbi:hypothetical protein WT12_14590 [Burkholderia territorii]|nr:hypothetical protein WT12_14590 [Burkholderia territorii]